VFSGTLIESTTPARERSVAWLRRQGAIDSELVARRALAATQLSEPMARIAALLRLASRNHAALSILLRDGRIIDDRVLEVLHGILIETKRQAGNIGSSMNWPPVEVSEILDLWLSELDSLDYDRDKASRYAQQLAQES